MIERRPDTNTLVETFDSPGEFGRLCKERRVKTIPGVDDRWAGGSWRDAMDYLDRGSMAHVARAEALLERLTYSIPVIGPEWQMAVAGAFPIVPEFLSGRPDCMRRKVHLLKDSTPIRIFINLSSSCTVEPETLARRGPVYLALALALARVRPVEVYGLGTASNRMFGGGDRASLNLATVIRVPINNTAAACGLLACPATTRQAIYAWQHYVRDIPSSIPMWKDNETGVPKALGLTPDDLYIAHTFGQDSDPIVQDPERFIREQIEKRTQSLDDAR